MALSHTFHSHQSTPNRFYPNTLHFSASVDSRKTASDESLLQVIDPGHQTITVTRVYDGELVKVNVYMPDLVSGEGETDDRNDDEDDSEKLSRSSILLVVSISKSGGLNLEFGCTAYPDEIANDSFDLDENLQKAFHKYLEILGIKPSTTNYLHEYMINKDSRDYLMWLKNLKKFIEE
ncbi:Mitochondrial glycoprotein family protein [Hibiscus syriacus]|uniref:Mitochondrial glycoprotein family protein n=1 Tax=Hibiscus syriacus TaxID=106335 RepID=A0A6A2X4M8_HIBSY|nr:Mitochondrial glycoprotein family protein [Hibiscus syriacus]